MKIFKFKKFVVNNLNSSMRLGTDSVLLGAWMRINPFDRFLLDIGSGTGIISLMAAQRCSEEGYNTKIIGVEIDKDSSLASEYNFMNSPWSHNLVVENIPIQEYFPEKKFNLIFSNPPYFINSQKSPDQGRNLARHTDSLGFEDLIRSVLRLLKLNGRFCLILPAEAAKNFVVNAEISSNGDSSRLQLTRLLKIKTNEDAEPKRHLMEFTLSDLTNPLGYEESCITLTENGNKTKEYFDLTKDFYL